MILGKTLVYKDYQRVEDRTQICNQLTKDIHFIFFTFLFLFFKNFSTIDFRIHFKKHRNNE